MGWKIITNNKDKWEVFSSITDSIIAEFKTEQELKQHLAMEAVYGGKLKAIELLMTFPNGWTINDKRNMYNSNEKGVDTYYDWVKNLNNKTDTYEEYYEKIDKKLELLLSKGVD